jgi:hypothetical protein
MAFTSRFGSAGSVLILILILTALPLLISFLFLFWRTRPVTCTCNSPGSPVEELGRSTAVFVGKVIHIEYPKLNLTGFPYNSRDSMIARFQVLKVWKGPATRTTDVRTLFFGDCGCKFSEGEDYLVYANGSGEQLVTDRCTRTKPISEAIAEVAALGEGETIETGDGRTSSNPILLSITPRTLAQYKEAKLVIVGANFTRGAKVVFDGPQFQSPVELDAKFENSSVLTVTNTFEPPIFPKEPLVDNHRSYKVKH